MWGSGNCWRNYSELLEVMSKGVCYGDEQLVPKGRGGVCLSLEVWLRLIYNILPNAWNVPGCSMTFHDIP